MLPTATISLKFSSLVTQHYPILVDTQTVLRTRRKYSAESDEQKKTSNWTAAGV